jgi:hypothetical protein
VSVTLDLSASGQGFSRLPEQMGDLLEERSTLMLHKRARDELRLISRQFRNLSVSQALRLFALANSFREALHHVIYLILMPPRSVSARGAAFQWRSTSDISDG